MSSQTTPSSRWNPKTRANTRLLAFGQQSQQVSLRSLTEAHSTRRVTKRSSALDGLRETDSREIYTVTDPVCTIFAWALYIFALEAFYS